MTILDVMPTNDGRADLVRRLTGVRGTVRMRHEWVVRLDYGKIRPWVSRRRDGGDDDEEAIVAVAGPDKLVLRGPRLPRAVDGRHVDEFDVTEGEVLTFATTWVPSWAAVPARADLDVAIESTRAEEEAWSHGCPGHVPHRDLVVRSLLTLRLLTHARDRRHRRGADHLAARGLRRRAQLGLPLHLAAGRLADRRGAR